MVPSTSIGKTPWLIFPRKEPKAHLRLFCFPYAGGNVLSFQKWPDSLPPGIEVCVVQPPGRGSRMREKPYSSLPPMVEAIGEVIVDYLDRPYAFFGHSMGAIISFELARYLHRHLGLLPAHLFLSGRRAPQVEYTEQIIHNLPDEEFMQSLRELNGTPQEVLDHQELMQLLAPLLRADFAVCETYDYVAGRPLDNPITVFGGLSDHEVRREMLEAWREQTTGPFAVRMLPGDHFFLHSAQGTLLNLLSQDLVKTLKPG